MRKFIEDQYSDYIKNANKTAYMDVLEQFGKAANMQKGWDLIHRVEYAVECPGLPDSIKGRDATYIPPDNAFVLIRAKQVTYVFTECYGFLKASFQYYHQGEDCLKTRQFVFIEDHWVTLVLEPDFLFACNTETKSGHSVSVTFACNWVVAQGQYNLCLQALTELGRFVTVSFDWDTYCTVRSLDYKHKVTICKEIIKRLNLDYYGTVKPRRIKVAIDGDTLNHRSEMEQ